jgi:hypothetical protein
LCWHTRSVNSIGSFVALFGKARLQRPVGLIVSPSCRLVAGAPARLLVPGKQDIFILGVIGLLVGGFLGYLIFRKDSQGGLCQPQASSGQSIGVVIVSLIWIRVGAAAEPSGADTDDGRQTEHSRVKARAGRGLPAIARGRGKRRR